MKISVFFLLFFSFFSVAQTSFRFLAFGDMPYFLPEDNLRMDNVIEEINRIKPQFSLFVGDFKSSRTICSNEIYLSVLSQLQKSITPLIYTPGDNEWTDCHRYGDTVFNPEERLSYLRTIFFPKQESLGIQKMVLTCQATVLGYKKFVENYYWQTNKVSFATFHIVGSNNNLQSIEKIVSTEYEERNQANLYWLKELFNKAKINKDIGVVIVTHADMFTPDKGSTGFDSFLSLLREEALKFDKPILLINGDSHKYLIDKPLKDSRGKTILHFTRLQVFGESDMHVVEILVNPAHSDLFEIKPHIVKNN
jgi:hypothetical protein